LTDLDSLSSSIAYSYFATNSSQEYIPLQLTPRKDLYLRPENLESLSLSSINASSLLTIDDLDEDKKLEKLESNYVLVDHNSLLPIFATKDDDDDRVVGIIDHHVDESRHLNASPRIIELVGSCSSLITNHFLRESSSGDVPKGLADLLLSTILIDTRLKPSSEGGKATLIDLKAVELLLPHSSFAAPKSDQGGVQGVAVTEEIKDELKQRGELLSRLKEDVSWMNGRDLLRRDYKEYTATAATTTRTLKYGLSTVPLGLNVWLDKFTTTTSEEPFEQGLLKDVREWMEERKLSLLGILTSYTHIKKKTGKEGKHRRELLIFTNDEKLGESVFKALENDSLLQLEQWKESENYHGIDQGVKQEAGQVHHYEKWKVWQQGNTKATRKQVAPVLKELVHSASK